MVVLKALRLVYGAILFTVLLLPFGFFNTMAEPYVSGAIWGFMLPVGYVAALSGLAVIFYPRSKFLKKLGFGNLLMVVGVSMLLSLLLYPRVLSISLLYGTNMVDTDYSTFTGAVFWLSLLSVAAGVASKVARVKEFFSYNWNVASSLLKNYFSSAEAANYTSGHPLHARSP